MSDKNEKTIEELKSTIYSLKKKLQFIEEKNMIGTWQVDVATLKITWSDNLYKLLGYNKEEITPSFDAIESIMHPDDLGYAQQWNREIGTSINVKEIIVRMIRPNDGETRFIKANVIFISDESENKRILGLIQDITEQKEIEDKILSNIAIDSLTILAAGLAHDYNNLFTAVTGNLSLAIYDLPNGELLGYLENALKAIQQAKNLTNQLFVFSKGGNIFQLTSTSFEDIIKEITHFILTGSNIIVEFNIPENLPNILVDEKFIIQVFSNIIVNARDAIVSHKGSLEEKKEDVITSGLLRILAEKIPDFEVKQGIFSDVVHISFTDNGIGIPEEFMKKIFTPFTTSKKHGKGIGLAVTKSIIQKNNGIIQLESIEGIGTTVHLYLPATTEKPTIKKIFNNTIFEYDGNILVLEDTEYIIQTLESIFKKIGCTPKFFRKGEELLSFYKKHQEEYPIIITDLTIIGGKGGIEIVQEIRDFNKDVIIIVASGYLENYSPEKYNQLGFNDVLPKPYKLLQLSDLLRKYFTK